MNNLARVTYHNENGITTLIANLTPEGVEVTYIVRSCDITGAYQALDTSYQAFFNKSLSPKVFSDKIKDALAALET